MELDEALSQISDIRRQMARVATFRGYRAATAAFSGLVALAAAAAQARWVPRPHWNVKGYLLVWLIAAMLSIVVAAVEMIIRSHRSESPLVRELTAQAAEQFFPCLAAGALVTLVMVLYAHDEMWLLPGLWAILFSLGLFSLRRVLPGAIVIVAAYYMLAGLACIAVTGPYDAFSPWVMAAIFAPGQFLAAGILYWTLERHHGQA